MVSWNVLFCFVVFVFKCFSYRTILTAYLHNHHHHRQIFSWQQSYFTNFLTSIFAPICNFMDKNPLWGGNSRSTAQEIPFYVTWNYVLILKELATGPCLEPDESRPRHNIRFPISLRSILILLLLLLLGLWSGSFSLRFCVHFSFHEHITTPIHLILL